VHERECDEVIRQYTNFIDYDIPTIGTEKFSGFNPHSHRVDVFISNMMSQGKYQKHLEVLKICGLWM
jgi:hypothetical protein